MLLTFLKIINILFRFIVSQLHNFKIENTFSSSSYFWYSVQKFRESMWSTEIGARVFSSGYFTGQKYFLVGGSIFLSRGCFVGPKFFLVLFHGPKFFFSRAFCRSKTFSRGYFVGLIFFLVANSALQRFSVVGCMRKSARKQKFINIGQTAYSIPNHFQQLPVLFILERYFIY